MTGKEFQWSFSKPFEFKGKIYDQRHGSPFDRGSADSYYHRAAVPHYFKGDTYSSARVSESEMTAEELDAYHAGYEWNEQFGDKKDWR